MQQSYMDWIIDHTEIEFINTGAEGIKIKAPRELITPYLPEIKANLDEFKRYGWARQETRKQAEIEREERIAAIEGLREIQDARWQLDVWQDKFNRSFDGEYAVGGRGVGRKPEYDFDAAYKKYPQAAAYLAASAKANSYNSEIAAIGEKALTEVIFGDYKQAMARMEADLQAFTDRHLWD